VLVTYFIGTAGSGKSTITEIMRRNLVSSGINVATVNLDPGVRWLPYSPDVDARDYVDYDNVATRFNLGPNGALIAATDMVASYADAIKEELENINPQYALIDTPGQIELFVFRKVGDVLTSTLGGDNKVVVYLFDANLVSDPFSFVSVMLLGFAVQFRFTIPQLNILTKSDLLSPFDVDKVLTWMAKPSRLEQAIRNEEKGLQFVFTNRLQKAFRGLPERPPLIRFSREDAYTHSTLLAEFQRIGRTEDELV